MSNANDEQLTRFHCAFPGGVRWRLTDLGVEIEHSGIERTAGEPSTVSNIWERFGESIDRWTAHYGVPCALIVATIATESKGDPGAMRIEPGYVSDDSTPNRISPGLMQTLISTARETLGDDGVDRAWLLDPGNSIHAGTAYIASQRARTDLDPPKVACAYNAGGVYKNDSTKNRWRMRQYPIGTSIHCDRFVRFFNDAVFALRTSRAQPSVMHSY